MQWFVFVVLETLSSWTVGSGVLVKDREKPETNEGGGVRSV